MILNLSPKQAKMLDLLLRTRVQKGKALDAAEECLEPVARQLLEETVRRLKTKLTRRSTADQIRNAARFLKGAQL